MPVELTNETIADGGTLPARGVQVGGTDGTVFQVLSTDSAGRLNTNVNGTVPVSASSLPLPTGASTAAKQPALGTAGTPSADVVSVQGVSGGTAVPVSGSVTTGGLTDTQLRASAVPVSLAALPALVAGAATIGKVDQGTAGASAWKVDPSGVTSPVSAAALPLPTGAATAAKQPALGTAGTPSTDVVTVQGISGGTAQPVSGTVAISGTPTVDTELPAAAALSDTAANPTAPAVGAFGMVYNGSTWHRQTGIAGAADTGLTNINGNAVDTSTGATGAGTQRVTVATDQPPYPVTTVANSVGSWSTATALAQTTTKKAVKTSAGVFGGYYVYNPNTSVAYIQVFNVASGSVTLGTTAPKMAYGIPPGSAANLEIVQGIAMNTAITLACTTGAANGTAPAIGLDLTILYL